MADGNFNGKSRMSTVEEAKKRKHCTLGGNPDEDNTFVCDKNTAAYYVLKGQREGL